MKPEEAARELIDAQLEQAGWCVQSYSEMNLGAGDGLAIREFPGANGPADYLLYVDAKAIGVVEAKPVGHTLRGVEGQSSSYSEGLDPNLPAWQRPLPFVFESTGEVTQFTNWMESHARSREVFSFFRPEGLRAIFAKQPPMREALRSMPELLPAGLWPKQHTAITNLERSLALGKPKALIQMATGSGKTFTAANIAYRMAAPDAFASSLIARTSVANRSRSSKVSCRRAKPRPSTSSTTSSTRPKTHSIPSTTSSSRPSSGSIPS